MSPPCAAGSEVRESTVATAPTACPSESKTGRPSRAGEASRMKALAGLVIRPAIRPVSRKGALSNAGERRETPKTVSPMRAGRERPNSMLASARAGRSSSCRKARSSSESEPARNARCSRTSPANVTRKSVGVIFSLKSSPSPIWRTASIRRVAESWEFQSRMRPSGSTTAPSASRIDSCSCMASPMLNSVLRTTLTLTIAGEILASRSS